MNLSHATELLETHGRYFSEPYKLFNFADDALLKDYLDFVVHEPLEWFRGLPGKLVTRGSFAKPKAALIKLLKHTEVLAELDASYIEKVHDAVWNTFKAHADAIVEKRIAAHKSGAGSGGVSVAPSVLDQIAEESEVHNTFVGCDDVESVHSVKLERVVTVPVGDWERRYRVLEAAYRDLLATQFITHPGLAASATRLLDALSSS